jgi:cellulose biosynthesis protein BcsQ
VSTFDDRISRKQDSYDYIVTGPNLSHLTLGALVASQHIVIPVSAAVWSTTGLRKFVRWINLHQEDEVIDAELLGLVATIVPTRTRIGRALLDELNSSGFPTFATSSHGASAPRMPSWTGQ